MSQYDYDLFVVGAGSGGVRAARIAANHGARVAIAEEYRYGGTCVIRGCVPKKLLVYASRFRDDFEDAGGFGWNADVPPFSWPKLISAKDEEVARLEKAYLANLEKAGVTTISDRAELTSSHEVVLKTAGHKVTAERILIATGGRPYSGNEIPGLEHTITSNEAFHLKELPDRIVFKRFRKFGFHLAPEQIAKRLHFNVKLPRNDLVAFWIRRIGPQNAETRRHVQQLSPAFPRR